SAHGGRGGSFSVESVESEGTKGPDSALMSHEGGESGAGGAAEGIKTSDPFQGIRFFEVIDQEKTMTFEVGQPGEAGYRMGQYWPRTGEYNFTEIVEGTEGQTVRRTLSYNERSGQITFDNNGRIQNPPPETDWQIINDQFNDLALKLGISRPDPHKPLGYPELDNVIQRTLTSKPIDPETLKEGDFIIFEKDSPGSYLVFAKVNRIERVEDDPPFFRLHSRGSHYTGDNSLELAVQRTGLFRKKITVKQIEKPFSINPNQEEKTVGALFPEGI